MSLARGDFGRLVEQFRAPGVVVPFGWPGVEQVVNRLEHFIHHEDIRRAAPDVDSADAGRGRRVLDLDAR